MLSATTDPRLPPEIEHLIFTLALQADIDDPSIVGTYLLVAKRVRDWLYPELYSVVVIQAQSSSEPDVEYDWSRSRPPGMTGRLDNLSARLKQHGTHVKALLVNYLAARVSTGIVPTALALCPNLADLSIRVLQRSVPDFRVFSAVPRLKRLSASISIVCHRNDPETAALAALRTVYRGITHLNMTWNSHSWPVPPRQFLGWFPSLTHIALRLPQREGLGGVLESDTRLKVVVLLDGPSANMEPADSGGVEDDRVVVLSYRHLTSWVQGARGGIDMWKFAERVVEERTRRRTNDSAKG